MNIRKNRRPPVCLTIAGVDPSGGAGIIADIKTFCAFGCYATAAIASITYQNTMGVFGAEHQSARSVRNQIQPILDDYDIASLKTGMLPTGEIISEVAQIIGEHGLKNFVVDPVVRSTSGFDLIDDEALRLLTEKLFPLSDLITPNIPEAERISRIEIRSIDDVRKAAKIMQSMGAKNVLIKGGHLSAAGGEDMSTDHLFLGQEMIPFEAERIDTTATHGTGCTLAAAITANLALGHGLERSVGIAKDFVTEAIRTAPGLGKGHSPINI